MDLAAQGLWGGGAFGGRSRRDDRSLGSALPRHGAAAAVQAPAQGAKAVLTGDWKPGTPGTGDAMSPAETTDAARQGSPCGRATRHTHAGET